jgi:hypothetical protein
VRLNAVILPLAKKDKLVEAIERRREGKRNCRWKERGREGNDRDEQRCQIRLSPSSPPGLLGNKNVRIDCKEGQSDKNVRIDCKEGQSDV